MWSSMWDPSLGTGNGLSDLRLFFKGGAQDPASWGIDWILRSGELENLSGQNF